MAVAPAKRLPEPLIAWRIYNAQLQHGKRGAPARAYRELRAQGYTMSDQWLYNLLRGPEPPEQDATAYEPAPGEVEYKQAIIDRQKRQARRRTGKPKRVRRPPKVQDTVMLELPTEPEPIPKPLQIPPMIMSSPRSIPTLELPPFQRSPYKNDDRWVAVVFLVLTLDLCAISWKLSALTGHWWLLAATLVLAVPMARMNMRTMDAAWPNWKGWVLVFLLACFVVVMAVMQL